MEDKKEKIKEDNIIIADPELLKKMYRIMLKIRLVEETIADTLSLRPEEIVCPCHLYVGQEAVAAGVCAALGEKDYVFSTHRSHGHFLAKGGDLKEFFAEVYGKDTGCSGGRGGSMHLVDPRIGFLGSSAIVGSGISLACGAGLASMLRKDGHLAVTFFGDGAVGEGVFHETLNFAALNKIPVIFVCENNLNATHMPISESLSNTNIIEYADAHKIPSERVDGNDVVAVFETAARLAERVRAGEGPVFMECMTYRWRGHVGPNFDIDKGLRTREEVDSWIEKCPIKKQENILAERDILSPDEMEAIKKQLKDEINAALEFAKESAYPKNSDFSAEVFK